MMIPFGKVQYRTIYFFVALAFHLLNSIASSDGSYFLHDYFVYEVSLSHVKF